MRLLHKSAGEDSLFAGVIIAESPRWIILAAKSVEHREDVLAKLTEWRTEDCTTPKLSSDIFYRTWHLEGGA